MAELLDYEAYVAIMQSMHGPIQIELTPIQAAAVLGTLQLALRHPRHIGPSAQIVRDIAGLLQAELQMQNAAILPYLNAGWHEEVDR